MLFASHGAGWPEPGRPVRLRMDHVLLDEDDGLVTMLAFESLGVARHTADVVLVAPALEADGPDARDDLRYLQLAAAAFGATFVRPGAGAPALVHRRGFATPGRTLLSAVPGAGGAGAFAMLALAASATEAAAVLAGEPLRLARPRVLGVRLVGVRPAHAGGAEVLEALAAKLGGGAGDAIVEYVGEGLASLPMPDRIAMASLGGARLGARASVFPSDEWTHAWLVEHGREADWRRTGGGAADFDDEVELDLASVAPRAPIGERVRFGPLADDDDLRVLASLARAGISLRGAEVVVGGRATRSALAAEGALDAIEAAGASVRDTADGLARATLEPGGFACGDDAEVAAGRARPLSAAAFAAAHDVAREAARASAPRAGAALDPGECLAAPPAGEAPAPERTAAHVPPVASAPFAGSPRGVVLRADRGDVGADEVLALGPRARARRGDAAALAALSSRHADAERAGRVGAAWNVVTAHGRYGEGATHDAAARACAALGIRIVIARDFAPAHARALAVHGVLPLAWERDADAAGVAAGDELELPGVVEALAAGDRVMLRDLTAGTVLRTRVVLEPEWRAIAAAGGLLASLGSRTARPLPVEA